MLGDQVLGGSVVGVGDFLLRKTLSSLDIFSVPLAFEQTGNSLVFFGGGRRGRWSFLV